MPLLHLLQLATAVVKQDIAIYQHDTAKYDLRIDTCLKTLATPLMRVG